MRKFKDHFTTSTVGNLITVAFGVLLFLGISNFELVRGALQKAIGVVAPFIYAFALAYILNNPINWFEQKVFKKLKGKKALSIITVYLIFLAIISALCFAVLPQLGQSLVNIIETVPEYLMSLSGAATNLMENFHIDAQLATELETAWINIVKAVTNFAMSIAPKLLDFSISLGNLLIKTLMTVIASIYMLTGKSRLIFQMKKLVYAYLPIAKANRLVEVANRSNRIFSGFITGKMIDSAIIGAICFVGMFFIYSPYAVLISVIIGVTNMIPFFGPFIGAIPSIFILLMVSPMTALIFTLFILILQQVDGNIIGPKILGDSTGLSAIWVLIAIVVGNGLFGFAGMLIGVPAFAVLYGLVSENIRYQLNSKGLDIQIDSQEIYAKQIGLDDDANEQKN